MEADNAAMGVPEPAAKRVRRGGGASSGVALDRNEGSQQAAAMAAAMAETMPYASQGEDGSPAEGGSSNRGGGASRGSSARPSPRGPAKPSSQPSSSQCAGASPASSARGSSSQSTAGASLFAGVSFILTGLEGTEESKRQLEQKIRGAKGQVIELDAEGNPIVKEATGDTALCDLLKRQSGDGRGGDGASATPSIVLLCDPAKGKGPKVTMKLFFGLALGLRPLRPAWVHACLRERRWLPPTQAQRVNDGAAAASASSAAAAGSAAFSSRRRGQPPTTSPTSQPPTSQPPTQRPSNLLLSGHLVVPLGSDKWKHEGWATLLRCAGAEVRADLPAQHHGAGSAEVGQRWM